MARGKEKAPIKFSPAAHIARGYAQVEAAKQGTTQIHTEHLVLGITRSSIVHNGLKASGINFNNHTVEQTVRHLTHTPVSTITPEKMQDDVFTQRAHRALQLAIAHAKRSDVPRLEMADLLIGILDESEGIGSVALIIQDITRDKLTPETITNIRKAEKKAEKGVLIEPYDSSVVPAFDPESKVPNFYLMLKMFGPDFVAYHLGKLITGMPDLSTRYNTEIRNNYIRTIAFLQPLLAEVQKSPTLSRRFAQGSLHALENLSMNLSRG